MENLSLVLWRERELLELLMYKLEVEKLVLGTGNAKWLAIAAREVEGVLESIRETELVRAVAADEAAARLGLSANPSLRALAEAVAEPWHSIMLDHRDAFVLYTREIMDLAVANRELLSAGQQAVRESLLGLSDGAAQYGHDGSAVLDDRGQRLVDRSI